MSRPRCIEAPDATHHVTSRGDRRENIFVDDIDRTPMLEGLNLFSSVESDKARQVREVIEDFGVISTTNLELRRSDQNRPETRTNAEVSLFAESSIAENRLNRGWSALTRRCWPTA